MDTDGWTRTDRHGQMDTDRPTQTDGHGQIDMDEWTRTYGQGRMDMDRWSRTEGHGRKYTDRRTNDENLTLRGPRKGPKPKFFVISYQVRNSYTPAKFECPSLSNKKVDIFFKLWDQKSPKPYTFFNLYDIRYLKGIKQPKFEGSSSNNQKIKKI